MAKFWDTLQVVYMPWKEKLWTYALVNNQSNCMPKRDTSQYNVHGIRHSIRIYAAQQQNNKL
jgi:hypothetical protein